jgi:hypothetical protein
MSDSLFTLTNLTTINNRNLADIDVTDLLNRAPLLNRLAAVPASNGTLHKYVKETGEPTVGFRDANSGRAFSKSSDTLVTVTLKILDASFQVDKALADAYMRGREAFLAREALRHLRASFFHAEEQIIYGTDNDSDGFSGLVDSTGLDNTDDTMVVDAEGTTESTGSSVWLLRTTDSDVAVVAGNDGNIEMGDYVVQDALDGSSLHYPAYYTPITGWLGLQVGSAYSAARIANLTADDSCTLTDDLIAQAIEKFPSAAPPTLMVMNRRSLRQLQNSRTATNPTGNPAPFPDAAFGIPIVVTDAITSTETLLTAAGS